MIINAVFIFITFILLYGGACAEYVFAAWNIFVIKRYYKRRNDVKKYLLLFVLFCGFVTFAPELNGV
ncbi:MAG: hypothetical protein J5760_01565, partial [Clostridia bacterium]|nr:hypothetical protein [Clostridia bacterium]